MSAKLYNLLVNIDKLFEVEHDKETENNLIETKNNVLKNSK